MLIGPYSMEDGAKLWSFVVGGGGDTIGNPHMTIHVVKNSRIDYFFTCDYSLYLQGVKKRTSFTYPFLPF